MGKQETTLEVEINAWGWQIECINEMIEKICEAHEGKRELHIKVNVGSAPA